jgi:hypothetical protein
LPPWGEDANLLRLGEVTYATAPWGGDSPLTDADLGEERGRVLRDVESDAFLPSDPAGFDFASARNGDATILPPGTPVHAVRGYAPGSRVAAHGYGRLYVYDAIHNPRARKGSDLLDIRGRTRGVRVRKFEQRYRESLKEGGEGAVRDPQGLRRLLDLVLDAPVRRGARLAPWWSPAYLLTFELSDGASVERFYLPEQDALSSPCPMGQVIKPPRALVAELEAALRPGRGR